MANQQNLQLSKSLSYLLRHGAKEKKLKMDRNGFCKLADVMAELSKMFPKQNVTVGRIRNIVENCPKQRFKLEENGDSVLMIRANQGHTIKDVKDMNMRAIDKFEDGPAGKIIHGTTRLAWESIRTSGLSKMKRNHIHMARGEFGEAKSGARYSSEVIITIDGNKAIKDGIKFFESENNVILSAGNSDGFISKQYFLHVYDRKAKRVLPL